MAKQHPKGIAAPSLGAKEDADATFAEVQSIKAHVDGCLAMIRESAEENAGSIEIALIDVSRRLAGLGERVEAV